MTTPPHLTPLPLPVVLHLSKLVHEADSLMHATRGENLAFVCSQTPHDAGRVAKALRFTIELATRAAAEFEKAAKTGGGDGQ